MEENNLQTVPTPSEIPQVKIEKNNNFLVTLLSVLLLISVFIAGFFAYQTQNLVRELSKQSELVKPTEPAKTESSNEKYYDSVYKYTIEYPKGWDVLPTPGEGFGGVATFTNPQKTSKFEVGKHISKIEQGQTLKEYFDSNQPEPVETIELKNMKLGTNDVLRIVLPIVHGDSVWKYGIYYTFKNNLDVYFVEYYTNDYAKDIAMVDEIVSTFKIDTENTVACTMEAKICPDGSSVGRSGPKCEFAACPTAKPTATTSPLP